MDVWVAKDDGTEIIRARDIAAVSLDYDGNVLRRGWPAGTPLVMLVAHRTHHDEHGPEQFHREMIRVLAELSDGSGTHLVRPVRHEARGWERISERF